MEESRSFLSSLFDVSFSQFIITSLIKVLFILGIIVSVIYAVALIAGGFSNSVSTGILALIFSPIAFLLMVIVIRVWLELILIVFRIEENTRGLRKEESGNEGGE